MQLLVETAKSVLLMTGDGTVMAALVALVNVTVCGSDCWPTTTVSNESDEFEN